MGVFILGERQWQRQQQNAMLSNRLPLPLPLPSQMGTQPIPWRCRCCCRCRPPSMNTPIRFHTTHSWRKENNFSVAVAVTQCERTLKYSHFLYEMTCIMVTRKYSHFVCGNCYEMLQAFSVIKQNVSLQHRWRYVKSCFKLQVLMSNDEKWRHLGEVSTK